MTILPSKPLAADKLGHLIAGAYVCLSVMVVLLSFKSHPLSAYVFGCSASFVTGLLKEGYDWLRNEYTEYQNPYIEHKPHSVERDDALYTALGGTLIYPLLIYFHRAFK